MSDTQPTHSNHSKLSSGTDARRHGGGSRHSSDSDNPSVTPTKSESGTPARPGSALNARLANSTPRPRLRPTLLRPLSSPLGRSLSMRVSKKEKRWSMRLDDPKSPISSTYRDDYQSPEALSLQSLNLETTTEQGSDLKNLNAPTTYRESYKWTSNSSRIDNKGQSRGKVEDKDTPKRRYLKSPTSPDHSNTLTSPDGPIFPNRTVSRNSQPSEQNGQVCENLTPQPVIPAPTSARSSSFFKRNSSSEVSDSQSRRERHGLSSTNGKSSSNEERVQAKLANENGTLMTKPSNKNGQSVNGEGLPSTGTPPTQKLINGIRGRDVPTIVSEEQTPRRVRAYQLQSSNGGSPFAYGSDSGYWV